MYCISLKLGPPDCFLIGWLGVTVVWTISYRPALKSLLADNPVGKHRVGLYNQTKMVSMQSQFAPG
jgi:hypothetical protein